MGTAMTIILAVLIIGYAGYTLKKAGAEAKAGKCSGCSYNTGQCDSKDCH